MTYAAELEVSAYFLLKHESDWFICISPPIIHIACKMCAITMYIHVVDIFLWAKLVPEINASPLSSIDTLLHISPTNGYRQMWQKNVYCQTLSMLPAAMVYPFYVSPAAMVYPPHVSDPWQWSTHFTCHPRQWSTHLMYLTRGNGLPILRVTRGNGLPTSYIWPTAMVYSF